MPTTHPAYMRAPSARLQNQAAAPAASVDPACRQQVRFSGNVLLEVARSISGWVTQFRVTLGAFFSSSEKRSYGTGPLG